MMYVETWKADVLSTAIDSPKKLHETIHDRGWARHTSVRDLSITRHADMKSSSIRLSSTPIIPPHAVSGSQSCCSFNDFLNVFVRGIVFRQVDVHGGNVVRGRQTRLGTRNVTKLRHQ